MKGRDSIEGQVITNDAGMTSAGYVDMRDKFAMNAPEMPGWFRAPPKRPCPVVPDYRTHLPKELHREWLEVRDEHWDEDHVTPEVRAFGKAARDANLDKGRWHNEENAHQFIAWRWHYADLMMAARGVP